MVLFISHSVMSDILVTDLQSRSRISWYSKTYCHSKTFKGKTNNRTKLNGETKGH